MADRVRPLARSPIPVAPPEQELSGWLVSGRVSRAARTITDCTPLAKLAVKASYDGPMARALAVPFGHAARVRDDVLLTGSGPGEWLALGAPGSEQLLAGWLTELATADELVTVVDLTHGRALLRITGDRAAEVLAHECALDLGAMVTGAALRTAVAGVATDLVRDDRAGRPSYLLHCERSSGRYLYDVLLDAGAGYGLDTDGFRP